MPEYYKHKSLNKNHFIGLAKRTIIGVGLSGLLAGGYSVAATVSQYFRELHIALDNGTVSKTEAIPLLCCIGPAMLAFGGLYRLVRKIKKSPSYDR